MAIPYEEIDCEIRPLVRLMNRFPGVRTEFSCAGHEEGQQGYVSFVAESQEALDRLVKALPFLHSKSCLTANHWTWRNIWIDCCLNARRELGYALRFFGHPLHAQRSLIDEIEKSLSAYLTADSSRAEASADRRGSKRPRRPKCA